MLSIVSIDHKGNKLMLVKTALEFGKISTGNTKMPGTTFAIDAFSCHVGGKLREIKGSTCSSCYAIKLQKLRPSVDKGYKNNLAKWQVVERTNTQPQWIAAMIFLIRRYNTDLHHRWFDAGDLQSLNMLEAIADVCRGTPEIKHWLPTREKGIVHDFLRVQSIPKNLTIRVSSAMVNGVPMLGFANTSTVHFKTDAHGIECKAYTRENSCGDCRACWNPKVKNVSYKKH